MEASRCYLRGTLSHGLVVRPGARPDGTQPCPRGAVPELWSTVARMENAIRRDGLRGRTAQGRLLYLEVLEHAVGAARAGLGARTLSALSDDPVGITALQERVPPLTWTEFSVATRF